MNRKKLISIGEGGKDISQKFVPDEKNDMKIHSHWKALYLIGEEKKAVKFSVGENFGRGKIYSP